MADPVSIIASAITVAATAANLSKALFTIAETLKNAPRELAEIANDISILSQSLVSLTETIEAHKALCKPDLYNHIDTILWRFKQVDEDLKKLTCSRRKLERLSWFFKRPKAKDLLSKVESIKLSLILELNIVRLAADEVKRSAVLEPNHTHAKAPNRFRTVAESTVQANRRAIETAQRQNEDNRTEKRRQCNRELRRWEADSEDTATWLYRLVFASSISAVPESKVSNDRQPFVADYESDRGEVTKSATVQKTPTTPGKDQLIIWNRNTEPSLVVDRLLTSWTYLTTAQIKASAISPREDHWQNEVTQAMEELVTAENTKQEQLKTSTAFQPTDSDSSDWDTDSDSRNPPPLRRVHFPRPDRIHRGHSVHFEDPLESSGIGYHQAKDESNHRGARTFPLTHHYDTWHSRTNPTQNDSKIRLSDRWATEPRGQDYFGYAETLASTEAESQRPPLPSHIRDRGIKKEFSDLWSQGPLLSDSDTTTMTPNPIHLPKRENQRMRDEKARISDDSDEEQNGGTDRKKPSVEIHIHQKEKEIEIDEFTQLLLQQNKDHWKRIAKAEKVREKERAWEARQREAAVAEIARKTAEQALADLGIVQAQGNVAKERDDADEAYKRLIQSYEEQLAIYINGERTSPKTKDRTGDSSVRDSPVQESSVPSRRMTVVAGDHRIDVEEYLKGGPVSPRQSLSSSTNFLLEEFLRSTTKGGSKDQTRTGFKRQRECFSSNRSFGSSRPSLAQSDTSTPHLLQPTVCVSSSSNPVSPGVMELQSSLNEDEILTSLVEPEDGQEEGEVKSTIFWEPPYLPSGSELSQTLSNVGWKPLYLRGSDAGQTHFLGEEPVHVDFFRPTYRPQFGPSTSPHFSDHLIISKGYVEEYALQQLGITYTYMEERGAFGLSPTLSSHDIDVIVSRSFQIREDNFRKLYRKTYSDAPFSYEVSAEAGTHIPSVASTYVSQGSCVSTPASNPESNLKRQPSSIATHSREISSYEPSGDTEVGVGNWDWDQEGNAMTQHTGELLHNCKPVASITSFHFDKPEFPLRQRPKQLKEHID
ncbi:hypothetical protein EJ04DRAFT_571530 [Polyplosphaeria fusca]|uniref:Fungal N-terminal domain-containing protein n=1 Tax=Polyplosphaeria fusca TaxID=682080 RepID=A0A9P4RAZ9_9PLEO|nr:hypothetical protein EJ04DRAFT_571530 [Polyplosphaeria fusca]